MKSLPLLGASAIVLVTAQSLADPIDEAVLSGDPDAVTRVLSEGIDPASLTRPLYFAARDGQAAIASILLDHGADPGASLRFGSALQIAARNGHVAVVEALLRAGADPRATAGEKGQTPLHDAAEQGRVAAARALLAAGADVNQRNAANQPPLHLAMRKERAEMVTFLRENGAATGTAMQAGDGTLAAIEPETARLAALICSTCHELEAGIAPVGHHSGPSLVGILGRPFAARDDFDYSPALVAAEGVWNTGEILAFISDPTGMVPGTTMEVTPDLDPAGRIAAVAHLWRLAGR